MYRAILKPGKSPSLPGSYRPIQLLHTLRSIMGKINAALLSDVIEERARTGEFGEEQFGFRPRRNTTQAVYALLATLRSRLRAGRTTWVCFVDLSRAYDRVPREEVLKEMDRLGVPPSLWIRIREIMEGSCAAVRVENETSQMNTPARGVPQGDAASCASFDFYMNAFRRAVDEGGIILDTPEELALLGSRIFLLMFADDACLIASTKEEILAKLDALQDFCEHTGAKMNFSKGKTEVMRVGGEGDLPEYFILPNGQRLLVTKSYVYLGVRFIDSTDMVSTCATNAAHLVRETYKILGGWSTYRSSCGRASLADGRARPGPPPYAVRPRGVGSDYTARQFKS